MWSYIQDAIVYRTELAEKNLAQEHSSNRRKASVYRSREIRSVLHEYKRRCIWQNGW